MYVFVILARFVFQPCHDRTKREGTKGTKDARRIPFVYVFVILVRFVFQPCHDKTKREGTNGVLRTSVL